MIDEDPAVLTWRIALAPRPRYSTDGKHWWRDLVTDAWWLRREAEALGYETEMREFEQEHPAPRLGDFMRELSTGRVDPYALGDPHRDWSGWPEKSAS